MSPGSSQKSKPAGPDIRAFFGGRSSSQTSKQPKLSFSRPSQGSAREEAIDIDDDDNAPASSSNSVKRKKAIVSSDDEQQTRSSPPKKKPIPTPRASLANSTKETPKPPKPAAANKSTTATKPRPSVVTANSSPRESGAAKKSQRKSQLQESSETSDDDAVKGKGKPKAAPRKTKAADDDYEQSDEEPAAKKAPRKSVIHTDSESEDEVSKAKAKPGPNKAPRKSTIVDTDGDDNETEESQAKPVPKKAQRKSQPKADDGPSNTKANDAAALKRSDAQGSATKFNWASAKAAKIAGPSAPGSKPIPNGQTNCLAGLSFVFTGELSSFAREEAIDLAKRFGGRVTGQPSSVTNFVVLGEHAGPAKLRAIAKHGLKTLSEDEFLDMIATRKGVLDEKTKAKMAKDEQKIRDAAKEMEKAERKAEKAAAKSGSSKPDVSSQLWTVRYAPLSVKEICGNKSQVEKLQSWLHDWSASLKSGFKKPGKHGMNIFRAVLITGPPGIGKTTSAHLCAKLEGFTPIELNASDARSKRLVESGTNINNTSLDGWMGGGTSTNAFGVDITNKSCLIMDEVDGMSGGDRGGVGALNALIKKSKIPIICIANDRNAIKLKPLIGNTFNLTFKKPEAASIRSRILTIAFKEKMKIPANVIDQLVLGAQSDIRQVVNMLSTWKLSSDTMDFDEGQNLAKMNEKYSLMTPFNVINKMLGPYLFSSTSKETLGDKMELYFHDHSFVPLFVQENYLKTDPSKLRSLAGPEKAIEQLRLMDRAASSISDGDLVDALIHGSEQHWSLMPLHAVMSSVRPASFIYGPGGGYGGPNPMSFPQWLGQNSKQGKLQRQLGDVQIRMRLKVSGDKPEIRQYYVPSLLPHLVKPLIDVGASAVDEVIERMDEYYLSKEEWDTVIELGLDQNKDELVLKKISTATKSALTRKYNASEHPVPFHKAQEFGKPVKKLGGGEAPDLEDVFDLDDDFDEEPEDKGDDSNDISKDKMIKTAKPKGKGKAAAAKNGKSTK